MMKLFSIYDKIKKAKFLVKVAKVINDKLPRRKKIDDKEVISTIEPLDIQEK